MVPLPIVHVFLLDSNGAQPSDLRRSRLPCNLDVLQPRSIGRSARLVDDSTESVDDDLVMLGGDIDVANQLWVELFDHFAIHGFDAPDHLRLIDAPAIRDRRVYHRQLEWSYIVVALPDCAVERHSFGIASRCFAIVVVAAGHDARDLRHHSNAGGRSQAERGSHLSDRVESKGVADLVIVSVAGVLQRPSSVDDSMAMTPAAPNARAKAISSVASGSGLRAECTGFER